MIDELALDFLVSLFDRLRLIRGHPFMTSTRRERGVRLKWMRADWGEGGQGPGGRPH